jgi:glycosyltransferase involved in cell wall biosynthesis
VQLNPTKKFLLIYDSVESNELSGFANVEYIRLTLNTKSFLFRWRLRNKVASILAQKGATKLLTTIPFPAVGLPQYYLKAESNGKMRPGKLQQMAGAIVTSERAKSELAGVTGFDASRILVVYGGSSTDADSMGTGEARLIRERYTDGKPYFLSKDVARDDLVYLLKAFSKFKKRQKSEMKLVILKSLPGELGYDPVLENYRYKNDVVLINHENMFLAAAYALVIPGKEGFMSDALDAMSVCIPVIVPHGSPVEEWGDGVALSYAGDSIDDLADKLMLIYKNEDVWLNHGRAGKETAALYTWERTSEAIAHMLFKNEHD